MCIRDRVSASILNCMVNQSLLATITSLSAGTANSVSTVNLFTVTATLYITVDSRNPVLACQSLIVNSNTAYYC